MADYTPEEYAEKKAKARSKMVARLRNLADMLEAEEIEPAGSSWKVETATEQLPPADGRDFAYAYATGYRVLSFRYRYAKHHEMMGDYREIGIDTPEIERAVEDRNSELLRRVERLEDCLKSNLRPF